MKGIGKNLRFYCETLLKSALKILMLVVVMSALMVLAEGGDYKETASKIIPTYLMIFVVIINFASAMNAVIIMMPLTVSLGSTRKSSYWGMLISEHLLNVGLLLTVYICYYFLFNDIFNSLWMPFALSVIGFFMLMVCMGTFVGVVSLKYGRTKGAVIYIILMLIIIFGMMGFFMSGVFNWITEGSTLDTFLRGPWILLLGIVADVVIGWLSYNAIRKCDLQIG